TVTDDGRGVDPRRVREAAATLGLAPGGSDTGVTELLFHPGLSTADEVSDVSGRGVGLDAVRDSVESIGGSVSLESDLGTGTRLMLRVPLVLSTLRVLLVRLGEEVVAVPTSPLRRLVRIPEQRTWLDGRETVDLGGAAVPVAALSEVLGWGAVDQANDSPEPPALVVDGVDGGSVALTVDELLSEREVVLRAAPSRLAGMNLLLGTAQLDDGSSALVLSPSACARGARAVRPVRPAQPEVALAAAPRVLLVEDTITTRELERSILVGAGYDVAVAADGQQAWEMLQVSEFDVVVSDVNMPRMDGIVLCRSIRASRRHANLPVVLVTSLHSDVDRRRGLDAGADAYITKSGFERAELLAALERVL
ncbi:MAG: response regulator, partial [Nocardioidaceae bacterium]